MTRPYPAWRRYLSYVADQTLEEGAGDVTEHLRVVLRRGRVLLEVDGAVYSWEDNYYNFREAFRCLDWDKLPGDRCLLLGLGLGCVPQIAEEHFGRRLHYTAVEYDETVAALAKRYLLYRLRSPVTTVVADAAVFVAQDPTAYDLILVDLFVDDRVPDVFEAREFLEQLRGRLSPGGCLISNRMAYGPEHREATKRYIDEVFAEVFPRASGLDVQSNVMLFSDTAFQREEC